MCSLKNIVVFLAIVSMTIWTSSKILKFAEKNVLGTNTQKNIYFDQVINDQKMLYNFCVNSFKLFMVVGMVLALFTLTYCNYQTGLRRKYLLNLIAEQNKIMSIIDKKLSLLDRQRKGTKIKTQLTLDERLFNLKYNRGYTYINAQIQSVEEKLMFREEIIIDIPKDMVDEKSIKDSLKFEKCCIWISKMTSE